MARGDGRRVAVWKFQKDDLKIDVPVHMKMDDVDGFGQKTQFTVKLKLAEPMPIEINCRMTDIDELKKKVFESLETQVARKWVPWIYVKVSGHQYHPGSDQLKLSNGLDVDYQFCEVADDGKGGTLFRFKSSHLEESYGRSISHELPGVGYYSQRARFGARMGRPEELPENDPDAEMRSLIPDTPENRQALDTIMMAMNTLRDRLKKVLHPDVINKTLDAVRTNGIKLLS